MGPEPGATVAVSLTCESHTALEALRAALVDGPRDSRALCADLGAAGFTSKQIRGARERLRVVIERHGFGRDCRTLWSLPSAPGRSLEPTCAAQASLAAPQTAAPQAARPADLHFDDAELRRDAQGLTLTEVEAVRMNRRLAHFGRRGMAAADARAVAVTLLQERDRRGATGFSCAECQCFSGALKGCAVAQMGLIDGPRAPTELWDCQYRRFDAP